MHLFLGVTNSQMGGKQQNKEAHYYAYGPKRHDAQVQINGSSPEPGDVSVSDRL